MSEQVYFVFDERFAAAFFQKKAKYKLFGRELLPFSYWHKVQLEYLQSGIFSGKGATVWDYWVASKVCSTRYPFNYIFKPKFSPWWQMAWKAVYGWRNVVKSANIFSDYLEDFAAPPKLWSGTGGAKKRLSEAYYSLAQITGDQSAADRGAAWEMQSQKQSKPRDLDDSIEQVAIYMRYGARTPEEAWNMPMGQLLWFNVCFLKMEGADAAIWTPNDEAAFEKFKEQRFEKIAKMAVELMAEDSSLTRPVANAIAAVNYWEKIVSDQEKASAR